MQLHSPRRDPTSPSRRMSGTLGATSKLYEIRDMVVDETDHSQRDAGLRTATPSELSSHSLSEASSRQLGELAVQVLRVACHRARERGWIDGSAEDLREVLREICATARANDLRVETLILVLKSTWWRLPEANGATRREAELTLAGVITLCIKEYYAPISVSTRRGVAARPANACDDRHLT